MHHKFTLNTRELPRRCTRGCLLPSSIVSLKSVQWDVLRVNEHKELKAASWLDHAPSMHCFIEAPSYLEMCYESKVEPNINPKCDCSIRGMTTVANAPRVTVTITANFVSDARTSTSWFGPTAEKFLVW